MTQPKRLALILPAGGARAAYQVGVLKYISKNFPDFKPTIYSGISAGSINSSFLAQGEPFAQSGQHLAELWQQITFKDVLKTNFRSVFGIVARASYDLFASKVTKKLLVKSILDATPLSETVLRHISFPRIATAIKKGKTHGISITTTNYHNGRSTVFFDCADPITPWIREDREAIRTRLKIRHLMASCSIPIIFEPIPIRDCLFGDGALRYNFPFSPSIHMGATHVFAISIRTPSQPEITEIQPDHAGMGFIAGVVLNSIFLDSLEPDLETLIRLNEVAQGKHFRKIHPFMIRPSKNLGSISADYFHEIPFHLRQLVKSTANPAELGDLLSYLLFSPGYIKALIDLGEKDAEQQHVGIELFVKDYINS